MNSYGHWHTYKSEDDSYEEPPIKRFLRNTRKPKYRHSPKQTDSMTLPPRKHVDIQSQLIDQISKLHEPLGCDANSNEQ